MKTKSNKLRTTFAVIYTDVMRSPAWAAMKPAYRALLVEMKAFYNRETKAAVPMSVRYAAKLLGVDKELAADCLEALSHYGFIREVRRGYLGANGVGIATEWRLTDEKYLRRSATLDFLRWDGVLYEPNSRKKTKPRPEIPDRPVRIFRQPRPEIPDRVHENPNKSHFEPVRKIQTHLKIYPSSTPAVELEAGGADAPTEFGIGHNAGPPLEDDDLAIPPQFRRGYADAACAGCRPAEIDWPAAAAASLDIPTFLLRGHPDWIGHNAGPPLNSPVDDDLVIPAFLRRHCRGLG